MSACCCCNHAVGLNAEASVLASVAATCYTCPASQACCFNKSLCCSADMSVCSGAAAGRAVGQGATGTGGGGGGGHTFVAVGASIGGVLGCGTQPGGGWLGSLGRLKSPGPGVEAFGGVSGSGFTAAAAAAFCCCPRCCSHKLMIQDMQSHVIKT